MKLTIIQDKLAELVARGTSIAPRNSPVPSANHARIVARAGFLSIATTDFDRMVEATSECKIDRPGTTTVEAAKLKQAVERLPKGVEVSLTLDEAKRDLILKAGRSRITFHTLPAEDWPSKKAEIDGATFKLSGSDLDKLFARTAPAALTTNIGSTLSSVFLHARDFNGKRVLAAVGTSGSLLFLSTIELPRGAENLPGSGGRAGIMLSHETFNAALRLFRSADEVAIEASATAVAFSTESTRLVSNLIAGVYPAYEPLVSDPVEIRALVDRERCANAVALLETFASKDMGHRLQCAGSDEGLVVAVGGTAGQGVDVVDADIEGEIEPFGMNGVFMKTMLGSFKSEIVALHPDAQNRRVIFLAEGEPEIVGAVGMMVIPTDLAVEPKHE